MKMEVDTEGMHLQVKERQGLLATPEARDDFSLRVSRRNNPADSLIPDFGLLNGERKKFSVLSHRVCSAFVNDSPRKLPHREIN